MNVPWWAVLLTAAVVFGVFYLRGLAGRLDRLHVRVEAARDALDAQLLRRSAASVEAVASGLLDPATALLLAEAAHTAQAAEPSAREVAESALSQALRAVFDDPEAVAVLIGAPGGPDLIADLATGSDRVILARRFYNDAVRVTQEVRRRLLVRVLRLAGHAELAQTFEIDDTPPAALSGVSGRAA